MGRLAYFQGWPGDSLERLAMGAKLISLARNCMMARKGERLQQLYVVVSGQIRLFIPLPNNMERVVALVGQGETLGESCLVLDESCPYHAITGKDSHLLVVDSLVFRREIGSRIELTRMALERVSRRLMETLRDTEICAQRSSVQRVASYLLLHRPIDAATAFTFQLPARKQDVAAKLNLTQETFSRVLSFLDKQGVIHVSGGQIKVADSEKLGQITTMKDDREAEQAASI